MHKVEKLDFLLEQEKKIQDWIWIVDTQVTDIPFGLAFLENFKYINRASYWRHGNTSLPENTNYNIQF